MSNLSALLVNFNDSEMKNSESLYLIIDQICEKLSIDIFIDTEVISGKKKDYFFIGIEFKQNYTKELVKKFLKSVKIRLETNKKIDISEVNIFCDYV